MSDSGKHSLRKALAAVGWTAAGLVVIIVALLWGVTSWLTSDRITELVERYAGRYLDADVSIRRAKFTIWSTWPHFRLEIDSLSIMSRTLPDSIRKDLPAGSDSLLTLDRFSGGINVVKLAAGDIWLGDVDADGLWLNLVAYNDSINNYNIVLSESETPFKMPYVTVNSLNFRNLKKISYYSAATTADIEADITDASLRRDSIDRNFYHMDMDGRFDATVQNLEIFRQFPFSLRGDAALHFKPFKAKFENCRLTLANVTTSVNMSVDVGQEVKISAMKSQVSPFNVMQLLNYLPSAWLPDLNGLTSDMEVEASVRLTAPWTLTATTLPSFDVDFTVPSSSLTYQLSNGRTFSLHNVNLVASLVFDGRDVDASYFSVPRFDVGGEGMNFNISGRLDGLTGSPSVEMQVKSETDCAQIADLWPALKNYNIKGSARGDTKVTFSMESLTAGNVRDVRLSGDFDIKGLSVDDKAGKMKIRNDAAHLKLDTRTQALSGAAFAAADASISAQFGNIGVTMPGMAISLKGTTLTGHLGSEDTVSLKVGSRTLAITEQGIKASLEGFRTRFSAIRHSRPELAKAEYKVMPDTISTGPHTPEWLQIEAPQAWRDLITSWLLSGSINAESGVLVTDAYPAPFTMGHLALDWTTDSVMLRRIALDTQATGLEMGGSVANLERFMLMGGSEPLRLRFDMALDTVNINQLAHTYETGKIRSLMAADPGLTEAQASKEVATVKESDTLSKSDTTTLLLPRNLDADVRLTAAGTVYTNLHLYDLGTHVRMHDGAAEIDSLRISSSFGRAMLNVKMQTANPLAYGVDLGLSLESIDLVRFFEKFQTVAKMWPEMTNLSGFISVQADMGFRLFPTMDMNIPTLQARIGMQGRDLKVHQNHFIRHLTRMLLIRTDKDIDIPTVEVRAQVHDNLLQLDPFLFIFNRYRLHMLGMNDFAGNLYYHIGVEKSPVPFKFGINIEGTYGRPKLRFGGYSYDPDRAMQLNSIIKNDRINVVNEVKYYLRKFVRSASEAETSAQPAGTSK